MERKKGGGLGVRRDKPRDSDAAKNNARKVIQSARGGGVSGGSFTCSAAPDCRKTGHKAPSN